MLPENKQLFEDKIKEFNEELRRLRRCEDDVYRAYANGGEKWVKEFHLETLAESIKQVEYQKRKFERLLDTNQGVKLPQSKFNLEEIKQIPIADILGRPVRSSGGRDYYKCPIHQETTPSFVVYRDQNRWHCFGACGVGGSVIDLVMQKESLTFLEACKYLNK